MELLRKLLEIISEFLAQKKEAKIEKEEINKVQIDQKQKTKDQLEKRKSDAIKPPKSDDFFNDDSW